MNDDRPCRGWMKSVGLRNQGLGAPGYQRMPLRGNGTRRIPATARRHSSTARGHPSEIIEKPGQLPGWPACPVIAPHGGLYFQGVRSMFSASAYPRRRVYRPKNGPDPDPSGWPARPRSATEWPSSVAWGVSPWRGIPYQETQPRQGRPGNADRRGTSHPGSSRNPVPDAHPRCAAGVGCGLLLVIP